MLYKKNEFFLPLKNLYAYLILGLVLSGAIGAVYWSASSFEAPSASSQKHFQVLNTGWISKDIGETKKGSTDYQGSKFIIQADGRDIWQEDDSFRFVYKEVKGDFEISAKFLSLTATHPWAKFGLMVRQSLHPSSRHSFLEIGADRKRGYKMISRQKQGGKTGPGGDGFSYTFPLYLKLVRQGDKILGLISEDGKNWEKAGDEKFPAIISLSLTDPVLVGLAVSSHNLDHLTTAEIEDLKLSSLTENYAPYFRSELVKDRDGGGKDRNRDREQDNRDEPPLPPSVKNQPPQAEAGADQTVQIDEKVKFDGSASKDKDGKIVAFKWNFGDGSRAEGMQVQHSYAKQGDYKVVLEVEDDQGAKAQDSLMVAVLEKPAEPSSKAVHKGDRLIWDESDNTIYRLNADQKREEIGKVRMSTIIGDDFPEASSLRYSDQEYLYAETLYKKPFYYTTLYLRDLLDNHIIKTIRRWSEYAGYTSNSTSRIKFITYRQDNNKAYFVMDIPQGSDKNYYPVLNYNFTTAKLEGDASDPFFPTGHTQIDLPIYLSPSENKIVYEDSSSVLYGALKIEGLGINISHLIDSSALGLGKEKQVDFSCIAWVTDNSKIVFHAQDMSERPQIKDLGYFVYDLESREAVGIEGGKCLND